MCAASLSDAAIFCSTQVAIMYFYRAYHFLKILQHVYNSTRWPNITSCLHDMTFHRENGRIRLLNTFKQTHMCLCMSDCWTAPSMCTCVK